MSMTRSAFPGNSRTGAGVAWVLALAALASACSEPGQTTVATTEPTEVAVARPAIPAALAAMLPAMVSETARLRPAYGNGFAETPLRMALTVLEDHVAAAPVPNVNAAVEEARGLLKGYRVDSHSSEGSLERSVLASASSDSTEENVVVAEGIDQSELDALELLLISIEEAMSADTASHDQPAPANANKENGGSS